MIFRYAFYYIFPKQDGDKLMKKEKHLPLFGIGPIFVISIIMITAIAITLSVMDIFYIGNLKILYIPFIVTGVLFILLGIIFWLSAIFQSKLWKQIINNKLITTGIYAYVRNPVYSAFLMMCTGAILLANDLWLCVLPFVYWIFLTVLIKNTEEKWLTKVYGKQYIDYCKNVNRCIPFVNINFSVKYD